jgi:O-antigen/teichoic acid export membrane protein
MRPLPVAGKLVDTFRKAAVDYGVSYASSLLGFLITLLVARILGAEEFAWVAAGNALGGFIAPLTMMGSELAFARDAVTLSERSAVQAMIENTFNMRVTVMLGVFVLLAIGAPFFTPTLSDSIATVLLASWAGMQGLSTAAWFDNVGLTTLHNRIVLGERIVAIALIFGMLLLPVQAHTALLAGTTLFLTRALFVVVQVRRWIAVSTGAAFRVRLKIPQRHVGNNLRVTAAALSTGLFLYGNQLLLGNDRIELASYGVAFQVMGAIFVFQGQSARMLSRNIAETCNHGAGIARSLMRDVLLVACVSALLSAAAFVLIQVLPGLLSDPKYEAATRVAPLLCAWVVIAGAAMVIVRYLVALHEESFYLALTVTCGIGAVILGWLIVPTYGGRAVAAILIVVHMSIVCAGLFRILRLSAGPRNSAKAP